MNLIENYINIIKHSGWWHYLVIDNDEPANIVIENWCNSFN